MKRENYSKRQPESKTPTKTLSNYVVGDGCIKGNKRKNNIMRSTLAKKIMLALLMLLSLMTVPVYAITHNVKFTTDDLSFSKIDGYDLVYLKDGAYLTDVGKPKLPTKSLRVAIPPGS